MPSARSIGTFQQVEAETSNKNNKMNHGMTLVNSRHSSQSIFGFVTKAISAEYMVRSVAMRQVSFDHFCLGLSAFF
jgi:hypothetical protein